MSSPQFCSVNAVRPRRRAAVRSSYEFLVLVVRSDGPALPRAEPMQVMLSIEPGAIYVAVRLDRLRIRSYHPLEGLLGWRRV